MTKIIIQNRGKTMTAEKGCIIFPRTKQDYLLCQVCKKPHGKKPNAKICDTCQEQFRKHGAVCWKIGSDIFVWVRRKQVIRAVVAGKDVKPERQFEEVIE